MHADPVGGFIWRWGADSQDESSWADFFSIDGRARFSPEVLRRSGICPQNFSAWPSGVPVLRAMDGTMSPEAIADAAVANFPECFRNSRGRLNWFRRFRISLLGLSWWGCVAGLQTRVISASALP
jgi:hypothetical protein